MSSHRNDVTAVDHLNRMATLASGSTTTAYTYRADGMRVRKGNPNTPNIYTDYAYDGQMPVEEFNYRSVYNQLFFIKVIRYGLGARGIDRIERDPVQGSPLVGYPIYDDHGNMIATLMKGSNNTCSLNDLRSYDAWGGIRTGNTSGEPHPTHCANLGHLQDDESGFIYMRARFYDPLSSRFIGEDRRHQGLNWFTYCSNEPISRADKTGRWWLYLGRDEFPSLDISSGDWWDPVYWFDWDSFVRDFNISITLQVVESGIDLASAAIEIPGWEWLGTALNISNLVPQIPYGPLSLGMNLEYMWQARIAMWGFFMDSDIDIQYGRGW